MVAARLTSSGVKVSTSQLQKVLSDLLGLDGTGRGAFWKHRCHTFERGNRYKDAAVLYSGCMRNPTYVDMDQDALVQTHKILVLLEKNFVVFGCQYLEKVLYAHVSNQPL